MKKVLLVLLVVAMVAVSFVACAPPAAEEPAEEAPAEDAAAEEPAEEAAAEEPTEEAAPEEPAEEAAEEAGPVVLNWNIGADPQTIDPGMNGASDGGDVINQTFEGLVREMSGTVIPGIAESWETSADGLTVTFHLRESNWSDGSPLTANDFVYSWLRAMAPETASEYSWLWKYTHVKNAAKYVKSGGYQAAIDAGVGGAKDPEDPEAGVYTQEEVDEATENLIGPEEVGVSAPDDYTFVVELESPTEYFVSLMAFYHFKPVKKEAVEAGPDGTWAADPAVVVCNGAFKLTEYVIGDGLVLEKNPEYWAADEVKIDVINGKFIDDAVTAFQGYNNGELDFLPDVPTDETPRLMAELKDIEFFVFPLLGTYYYNFNMDLDIWEDPNVRRALSLAINRQEICDTLASGQVPAAGFVPPGFKDDKGNDFFETAGMYGFSTTDGGVAEAQQLLADAGYPGGEGFPVFELMYNTSEGHQTVAELVQEQLKTNLGIECTLANQEWAVFQDTRQEGNYELARGGWLTDFMDPIGMLGIFVQGNAYNDPNYDNEEFETLIADAAAATTAADHFAKLYEAQDVFVADPPIIPVYHYTDVFLVNEKVVGWDRSVLGTVDLTRASIE